MSSQINTQVASIEQLVVPVGTGLETNTNASLPAIKGSIATDIGNSVNLFMGDGAVWRNVSGGVRNITGYTSTLTLTSGGQPSLTNCKLTLLNLVQGLGTAIMVSLSLSINQTITVTGQADWSSAAGAIPIGFRPPQALYFPCTIASSVSGVQNTYFVVNVATDGTITVRNSAGASDVTFFDISCVYNL